MTRTGRPRALSPSTLEEAANEIFLERGYVNTSIDDIATRAGVSRATFFNYFSQKSDVLFFGVDEALSSLEHRLDSGQPLREAITAVANSVKPDRLPLVARHAEAMGVVEEARDAGALRVARLREVLSRAIADPVWAAATAGAISAAVVEWAASSARPEELASSIDNAIGRLSTRPAELSGKPD